MGDNEGLSTGFFTPPDPCTEEFRASVSQENDDCDLLMNQTSSRVPKVKRDNRCECLGKLTADENNNCAIQHADYFSVGEDIEYCTGILAARRPTTAPTIPQISPSQSPVQISEEASVVDNSTVLLFFVPKEESTSFPFAVFGMLLTFLILCVAGLVYKCFSKDTVPEGIELEGKTSLVKRNKARKSLVKRNKARKSFEFYYDDEDTTAQPPDPLADPTSPISPSSPGITLIERIDSHNDDNLPLEDGLSLKNRSASGRSRRKRSRRKASQPKNDHRRSDHDRGRSRSRPRGSFVRSGSTRSDKRGSAAEKLGRLSQKAKKKVKDTTSSLGRAIEKAASKAVFQESKMGTRKLKMGASTPKRKKKKKTKKKSRNLSSMEMEFSSGTSEGLGSPRTDSESSVDWRQGNKRRDKKTVKKKKSNESKESESSSLGRSKFFRRVSTLTELQNAVARFEKSRKGKNACPFAGIYEKDHEVAATLIDGKVKWTNGHTTAYKVKSNTRIAVKMPLGMGTITGTLQDDGSIVFNEDMIWTRMFEQGGN